MLETLFQETLGTDCTSLMFLCHGIWNFVRQVTFILSKSGIFFSDLLSRRAQKIQFARLLINSCQFP